MKTDKQTEGWVRVIRRTKLRRPFKSTGQSYKTVAALMEGEKVAPRVVKRYNQLRKTWAWRDKRATAAKRRKKSP
jgi:hypothetical protein